MIRTPSLRSISLALGRAFAGVAGSAGAAVINGPALTLAGSGWVYTGIEFSAVTNSILTSFSYANQGQADTVILTDSVGNILHSVNTPASVTPDVENVNWALTAGQTYFLLQTVASNELYASFNQALPSNSDISIVVSGTFAMTLSDAVAASNFGANEYWAAFNDITTTSGNVPEPLSLALVGLSLAGLGYQQRKRRAV